MLGQCTALTHLNLSYNWISAAGAERLSGLLTQCTVLAHLDLSSNYNFGDDGAERLTGELGQCRELVHLNLSLNGIGTVWKGRIRDSCRGQASGLVL